MTSAQEVVDSPTQTEIPHENGDTLASIHELEDALGAWDQALTNDPGNLSALCSRGDVLAELGRLEEAIASYDRVLTTAPGCAEALCTRGNLQMRLKRYEDAVTDYDSAIAANPAYPEALYNRGNALVALKQQDAALVSYERAIEIRPDFIQALNNRAQVLVALDRCEEALAVYDHVLLSRPNSLGALITRGKILLDLKRPHEALESVDRALSLDDSRVDAWEHRGNALIELNRLEEALKSYLRAVQLKPELPECLHNIGFVLMKLRQPNEALGYLQRALDHKEDQGETRATGALCHLLTGDLRRGFEALEWRWHGSELKNQKRDFRQPLWLGDADIRGKTILLHAEQGFGDTLQFCRYAREVREKGARVLLEVPRPLKLLLSGLEGVSKVIATGDRLPRFDFHTPLMSLAFAFGTTLETVPAKVPYLTAPRRELTRWRKVLESVQSPRVGIVWSGNSRHKNDVHRSLRAADLEPLCGCGVTLVSLQKDPRPEDRRWLDNHPEILRFGDSLQDFADTAALVSLVDLVVTVDTSIAHLAGALAVPVWILLPHFSVDWRWGLEGDRSPWYPTATLYRQPGPDAWTEAIAHLAQDVRERFSA